MKKIILLSVILIAAFSADAQRKQPYNQYGGIWKRLQVDSAIKLPTVPIGVKDYGAGLDTAQVYYSPADSSLKIYTGSQWITIGSVTSVPDTAFWRTNGNDFGAYSYDPILGTIDSTDLRIKVNDAIELVIPAAGIKNNNSDTNRILVFEPWSKKAHYRDANSLGSLKDSSFISYKKDSVLFFAFDTDTTTLGNNWANYSPYATYVTETPVASGLDIVSTLTSYNLNGSSPRDTGWESAYNDVTISMEFQLISAGTTNGRVGTSMHGATNIYANRGEFYIDLMTGYEGRVNFATTHFGNFILGTLANVPSANDVVKLIHRRRFDVDILTVINITDGTSETFTHSYGGVQAGCATTNIYPGFFVSDIHVILRDYRFYATTGYNPDFLIVGASLQQNQMDVTSYDSSYAGRLQQLSNRTVGLASQCANSIDDFMDMIQEIRALKPKTVVLGDLGYNEIYALGYPSATWMPLYKAFVDSIINLGCRVLVQRASPNPANSIPDTLNAFVDSVYSNHPKVQILNLYNTTVIYNESFPNNADPAYFRDGIHWNNLPSASIAMAVKLQMERFERYNLAGATDVDFRRLNQSLLLYEDTGTASGVWKNYTMPSQMYSSGNQLYLSGLISGGTTNRIPKYTSSTTLGNSEIADVSNSIRIDDETNLTTRTNSYRFFVRSGYTGNVVEPMSMINTNATGAAQYNLFQVSAWSAATGSVITSSLGRGHETNNLYFQAFGYVGSGSTANYLEQQFYGNANLTRLYASGNFTIGSSVATDNGYKLEVGGKVKIADSLFHTPPTAANMTNREVVVWNSVTGAYEIIAKDSVGSGSLPSIGNQGEILQVSNGAAAWKYDTTTLVTFSAGANFAADTAAFTDSTIYGSFKLMGNDTFYVTGVSVVLYSNNAVTDTLGIQITYNDTINVIGSHVFASTYAVNNETTGQDADADDFTGSNSVAIPPGNWVWLKSPTVVAGRKPYRLSVSIIGYKKRVN